MTNNKRILQAVLLAILGMSGLLFAGENPRTAAADGADAVCDITPKMPVLADTLTMTVTLTADSGVTGTFPDFGGRYGDFRVERSKNEPVQTAENKTVYQRTYFLKPLHPGEGILPPIPIELMQNQQKSTILIPAGTITIESEHQPESASLDSFAPARGATSRWPIMLAIVSAGLLFAGLGFFLAVRHQRKRGPKTAPEPVLTPYERANAEIDALAASKLWVSDVKQFYLKLTGTVRWFIEETTGLKAPERTTEEFLHEAEYSGLFDDEMKRHLALFLEFADLVKFAKFHPEESDIFDGIRKARDFVREPVTQEPQDLIPPVSNGPVKGEAH